jgi:hypothetical protein
MWIAALACLAGCGQILASSRVTHGANSDQIALAEMPSCHHSHSSPSSQQKKQDSSTVSCCLPDAISQKTATDLNISAAYATTSGVAIDLADQPYALAENPLPARLHSGRQTILQTHLLRI